MIVFLDGLVDTISTDSLYIDVHGVGYQVFVPVSVLARVGKGEQKRLYTYQHVREDDVRLFGFLSVEELELFKLLISVNGVGPKAGIGILGAYGVEDIVSAIQRGDERLFASVSGIGKKGAAKIVIDLKGKVSGIRVASVGGQEKLKKRPPRTDEGESDHEDDNANDGRSENVS
jgi:Holliday junction DNA helicase RuvA